MSEFLASEIHSIDRISIIYLDRRRNADVQCVAVAYGVFFFVPRS